MKFDLQEAIDVLARTPKVLRSLLSDLPENWTSHNEGVDTWSPYDVIGHLIHGEDTDWIPRAKIILGESQDKTFQPYDRFAQFENSKGKTLSSMLIEFTEKRASNLEILSGLELTDLDLQRKGTHPELGSVTLEQLLSAWVVHDLGHIVQISRVMAKQYKDAVGPWSTYLTVVNK